MEAIGKLDGITTTMPPSTPSHTDTDTTADCGVGGVRVPSRGGSDMSKLGGGVIAPVLPVCAIPHAPTAMHIDDFLQSPDKFSVWRGDGNADRGGCSGDEGHSNNTSGCLLAGGDNGVFSTSDGNVDLGLWALA
jgi:hypothetical protein